MELVVAEEEGSEWSELPMLLLWMIEERLSVGDSLRFAAVCKNWLSSFKSCRNVRNFPGKFTMPWVMLIEKRSSNKREFFSILDGKRFTFEYPEFYNTGVLSSCQGWFLLQQWKFKFGFNPSSVFLFNPFTGAKGAKAKLPKVDEMVSKTCLGVFSITSSGAPDYVILSKSEEHYFAFWIARPGDRRWRKYRLNYEGGSLMRLGLSSAKIFLVGSLVYYFDGKEQLVVFDMESHVWSVYQIHQGTEGNIVEYKGEITKVCRIFKTDFSIHYRFVRLTLNSKDKSAGWSEMKDEEIENTIWLLHPKASFVAKDRDRDRARDRSIAILPEEFDHLRIKVGAKWVNNYSISHRCFMYDRSSYFFAFG